MKHKRFEEWLILSLYDELSEQERVLLDHHLTTCKVCRNDVQALKKFHSTATHRKLADAQEHTLLDARRSLRLRLYADAEQKSFFAKIRSMLDGIAAPSYQMVFGGTAVLALGILIGYSIFQAPAERSFHGKQAAGMEAGESQIVNIRFLDRDVQTGNVEFTFETVTPVRIRGNVNDDHIQKVLARALVTDQNVGTRLRAVNMIGTQSGQKQTGLSRSDEEVKSALVSALLHDRNLGVRKEALYVLKHYLPDPVVVRAFLNVLANEKNTGLKIAAINSLDLTQYENQPVNREILEMFKNKAQSDDNNYIRIKAKTALQEVQQ